MSFEKNCKKLWDARCLREFLESKNKSYETFQEELPNPFHWDLNVDECKIWICVYQRVAFIICTQVLVCARTKPKYFRRLVKLINAVISVLIALRQSLIELCFPSPYHFYIFFFWKIRTYVREVRIFFPTNNPWYSKTWSLPIDHYQ